MPSRIALTWTDRVPLNKHSVILSCSIDCVTQVDLAGSHCLVGAVVENFALQVSGFKNEKVHSDIKILSELASSS